MVKEKIEIVNKTGLHARPASQFVQKANQFKSDIYIQFESKQVNAKSILGLMSLGLNQGSEIILKVEGEDEKIAVKELKTFVENLRE